MLDLLVPAPENRLEPSQPKERDSGLIGRYLAEQHQLTAVARFAQKHAAADLPVKEKYYRDLLPLSAPGPGEQYAFEVDLDGCTGCKACVTACHTLNGLDEDEMWRSVGLLTGGSPLPIVQHVTAACHHCVEPACMIGCPVNAYEKDPVTGIVKHLDDQCIGCQYCTMTCPFEVPQYSESRGIVRKCDMCQDRLEASEAPACVQGCPNSAIRIVTVSKQETRTTGAAAFGLVDAPDPHLTLPTTIYKSARSFPGLAVAADHHEAKPAHGHPSLVGMLVLTQLGVGILAADLALAALGWTTQKAALINALLAFTFTQLGLLVATTHLGRPHLAFRAFLGLRTSWLSREIVVFGMHSGLMFLYLASLFFDLSPLLQFRLGVAAAGSGLCGVFCSAKVYIFTGRPSWTLSITAPRFLLSTFVMGLGAVAATNLAAGASSDARPVAVAAIALLAGLFLKMISEAAPFFRADLRHSATLLRGVFRRPFRIRLGLGVAAGAAGVGVLAGAGVGASSPLLFGALFSVCFATTLAGELFERWLYFAAVGEPRMPGGVPA